jgi:flagellin
MTAQIRGLNQGVRNSQDAISLSQTAEGALDEVTTSLQRIRELALQSKNATNSADDRKSLNQEARLLFQEISRVKDATKFNGVQVIGSGATTFKFQVGYQAADTIDVSTGNVASLSGFGSLSVAFVGGSAGANGLAEVSTASKAIKTLDTFLDAVNSQRAKLGAIQNRFESVIRNGQNVSENLQATRSRIMDADFAQETSNLTRSQILQQAGTAMLAQANQVPQSALSLLRG